MYSDIPKPIIKKNLKPSTKATSKEGVRQNIAWLNEHRLEYQGQWVALNEGTFLASNENSVELHRTLKTAGQLQKALFFNLKIGI
ncbi:hypothetical protein BGP_4775 [Beggiatoa sp. PS]|nr:hypothetical protein BGP_4775 [Beggiatoa sp. PS]